MPKEATLREERLQKWFPLLLEIITEIIVTSLTKLIRDLFLTVRMNFAISLSNLKGPLHPFFFQNVFLSFVNTHTVILFFFKKKKQTNNNMK